MWDLPLGVVAFRMPGCGHYVGVVAAGHTVQKQAINVAR
jgi:hypothetical protein